MLKEGTISNMKNGKASEICHYRVECLNEPSERGINGGKITKLLLQKKDEITCSYNAGWDIKPKDELSKMALCILLKDYN
ncbi:MAG: hypothetical protein IJO65_11125 [Lachnospiraceae bacterium]|nr:hypothetical protein [Lachnospiraceae bacterium]